HRAQFFARERPAPSICSNCHVAVTPKDTARFIFPSLGDVVDATRKRRDTESDFAVKFPHELHMDAISQNQFPAPRGVVSFVHAGFQKEKPKEESNPKNCVICHQTYQPQGDSSEEYVTKPPKG